DLSVTRVHGLQQAADFRLAASLHRREHHKVGLRSHALSNRISRPLSVRNGAPHLADDASWKVRDTSSFEPGFGSPEVGAQGWCAKDCKRVFWRTPFARPNRTSVSEFSRWPPKPGVIDAPAIRFRCFRWASGKDPFGAGCGNRV